MSTTENPTPEHPNLHERVELIISDLLRWGVLGSLLLVGIGTLVCFFYSHDYGAGGGSVSDLQRMIHPEIPFAFSFAWLFQGLAQGQGQAILVTGLLLLIATPIARVAVSVVTFAIEKDWTYAVITAIVLALITLSFFLGKAG